MSGDTMNLINTLKLKEDTDDEALAEARSLALRYLRSRSPVPQTIMTIVERGAMHTDAITDTPNQPQETV